MINESKIQFWPRAAFSALLLTEQLLGRRLFAICFAKIKNDFLRRLAAGIAPDADSLQVDRREGLDPDSFRREYFNLSRPVIFSGAAKDWDCCRKWDLDYFSLKHGQNDLLIVQSQGLTTRAATSDFEFLSMRDLVGNIKAGGDKYLRFNPLLHDNPELAGDLNMNWLRGMQGGKTFGNTYYMFMGGKGQRTLLHSDQPCNLYVQVYGEKKWTLFLPDDSACLYPEVTNTAYVRSPVDIDRPDLAKYPLYKSARKWTAHLRPGDVMYIPPHVWHQVENLTDTIAVGYRFSSLRAALRSSLTFTLLRVLATNPPIWKTRNYGKIDTNLIWAHTGGKINEVLTQRARRAQAAMENREDANH